MSPATEDQLVSNIARALRCLSDDGLEIDLLRHYAYAKAGIPRVDAFDFDEDALRVERARRVAFASAIAAIELKERIQ